VRLLDRLRAWLDPEHDAFLKRKRFVLWAGRWVPVEAYLDEQQFVMVLEVGTGDP
jgi:hypothetical protein